MSRGSDDTPSGVPRLPWRAIVMWVSLAIGVAWLIGFAAGVLVRVFVPTAVR